MTKGKPWDIEEICQLRGLVEAGKSVMDISRIMVKTLDSIKQRMFDLKLKEKIGGGTIVFSSSSLELLKDLPSIRRRECCPATSSSITFCRNSCFWFSS